jgi:hypothetical protein
VTGGVILTIYELITVGISATALLAVVVSLWFLRGQVRMMSEQTRQLRLTLEMSAESAVDVMFVAVTQAYLEYPALRPIFNEREALTAVAPLDHEATYRASALAEMLLDAIERALNFKRKDLAETADGLQAWIRDSFRNSAFLRAWFATRRSWYSSDIGAILDDVEAEIAVGPSPKAGEL